MNREIIPFTDQTTWLANRCKDLTSSDISCLFSCGYQTYEQLVENKKNKWPPKIEWHERLQWGIALQEAIANEFARQNKWTIRKKTEYIRIPELRLGSSFDYEIITPLKDAPEKFEDIVRLDGLLEIKNVDSLVYKRDWLQRFEIEATPYIELQVQHQLLVSGLPLVYIGVLVGGNKGIVLRREVNEKVRDAILVKAKKFWEEVDERK